MVQLLKLDGDSLADIDRITRVVEQLPMFEDERLVIITSAMGQIRRRIGGALLDLEKNKVVDPEEIFQEFERLLPHLKGSLVTGYRDATYLNFKNRETPDPSKGSYLHGTGDILTAIAFNAILQSSDLESRLICFSDDNFPLIVNNGYGNVTPNLRESRRLAKELLEEKKERILVIPDNIGIHIKERTRAKIIKTFGHDTYIATFAHLYALKPSGLWISTPSGIESVNGIEEEFPSVETVEELSIQETKEAYAIGANVPSSRALDILRRLQLEGTHPNVCIVNGQDLNGDKTYIAQDGNDQYSVKLVSGCDVILYDISGNLGDLQNTVTKTGVDWYGLFNRDHARIVVAESSERTIGEALRRFTESRSRVENKGRESRKNEDHPDYEPVKIISSEPMSYVGVVGSNMHSHPGVIGRAASALAGEGINISEVISPGDNSIGLLVERKDRKSAVWALYKEFFQRDQP